ncbi:exodeoxyribonuclease VII small subunit [Marinilabilia rubra]|uniref:Exodeoxyribonuclease VII small subunit n=1 Tax=Marinilabilia rubra TaxID=2162893 RepID=A0A2U2B7R0_9BACT|nr:exodeoxyribonuclease VII small subunit [Marinilabilia rubra]PWD99083.1 exodeoxyribonuclease VII small subunit [Marinilabilia rubra]
MPKKKLSYNEAITEIEEILERMESDELDVDELSEKVKRVSELVTYCRNKLKTTEEEVEKVLKEMEE